MTFLNSAMASLHTAGKGIHLALWLVAIALGAFFVAFRKASEVVYCLGVLAGQWYYSGGREAIADHMEPVLNGTLIVSRQAVAVVSAVALEVVAVGAACRVVADVAEAELFAAVTEAYYAC